MIRAIHGANLRMQKAEEEAISHEEFLKLRNIGNI